MISETLWIKYLPIKTLCLRKQQSRGLKFKDKIANQGKQDKK